MNKLNPNWITGFVDAEGCFYVRFHISKKHKTGWGVCVCFQIRLHVRDKNLLLRIKSYFNDVGNIYTSDNNKAVLYQVRKLSEITNVIIPHFEKYPLLTQKQSDYILFKNIVTLMNKGEHLTMDGIKKIVDLKACLNNGLSNKLKIFFSKVTTERPIINSPINIDYNWVAGFFSGEGCFSVGIRKSTYNNNNYQWVSLRVIIVQHSRDKLLMNKLKETLGCGTIYEDYKRNLVVLAINRFMDISSKIIPLFNEYNIQGVKVLDFQDFCKTAKLVSEKAHLTSTGIEKIREIKFSMNKGRYIKKEKLPLVR